MWKVRVHTLYGDVFTHSTEASEQHAERMAVSLCQGRDVARSPDDGAYYPNHRIFRVWIEKK